MICHTTDNLTANTVWFEFYWIKLCKASAILRNPIHFSLSS